MTNPTPRPALRKAEDADVHPAAPRPTRSPRSRTTSRTDAPSAEATPAAVTAVPASRETPAAKKAPAKPRAASPTTSSKRRQRKFSGSTSDHMRVAETVDAVAVSAHEQQEKSSAPIAETSVASPSTLRAATTPGAELLKGKTVELEVHVPKALRKAARTEAKQRGLDLDTVVIDLLHAWLTDPR